MTRRERLERKLELREEWAWKAAARSEQRFAAAHTLADSIPLGQPILVGHQSEAHARRDADRIHNNMQKGVELSALAEHHGSRAGGIERALKQSVFSDDDDAVEALEARAEANEEKRDRMKKINAMFRKGDAEGLAAIGLNLDTLRASVEKNYSWDKQPYPKYELTNLGARIRADRERIKHVKVQRERAAQAECSPNGVTIEQCSGGYVRVTFAQKPDREILTALKAAGFWWGSGSWAGKADSLPADVSVLAACLP